MDKRAVSNVRGICVMRMQLVEGGWASRLMFLPFAE